MMHGQQNVKSVICRFEILIETRVFCLTFPHYAYASIILQTLYLNIWLQGTLVLTSLWATPRNFYWKDL